MRPDRFSGLTLLFVVLGGLGARGADSPSASVLKKKGLAKSGITFVIEAEEPVLAKMKELRAIFAGYASAAGRQPVAEQVATRLTQLQERRVELQDNLNDLNQQINEQGYMQVNNSPRQGPNTPNQSGVLPRMIAQRNLIKGALAEIGLEQKSLKAQMPQVEDRSALDKDVKEKAEACRKAVAELKPMVVGVTKKYADLRADVQVKAAIGELTKAARVNLKLGPSDAFKSGAKALDEAERRLVGKPKTSSSRKNRKSWR
jgi:hypothetical protein